MNTAELLSVTVGAVLVNNIVLSRILGTCPFLGVSKKLKTALGMGCSVTLVMTISSFVTAVLYHFLLAKPFMGVNLAFARTLVFIVVIAALVQIVEILMQKFSRNLYQALGIYLPLITTNCAVLSAALLAVQKPGFNFISAVAFGFASALGFTLAIVVFAGLRARLRFADPPRAFKGFPLTLIAAGLLAMAFSCFSGVKLPGM